MKREDAKNLIPIIQAFADGAEVEFYGTVYSSGCKTAKWHDTDNPSFDEMTEWRIKPKPREYWSVMDRDGDSYHRCDTREEALNLLQVKRIEGRYGPYKLCKLTEILD